jgi:hypothetical protein
MKTKAPKLRQYIVTYSVHREETYRVIAESAEDAEDLAFSEGVFIDTGDTTDVIPIECEECPAKAEAP